MILCPGWSGIADLYHSITAHKGADLDFAPPYSHNRPVHVVFLAIPCPPSRGALTSL